MHPEAGAIHADRAGSPATSRQAAVASVQGPEAADPVLPRALHVFVAAVTLAALALTATAFSSPMPPRWELIAACLAFAIGDTALFHIRFGHNQQSFTWSETAIVVGLGLMNGPWLVAAAGAGVALAHLAKRRPPIKVAFNSSTSAVGAAIAVVLVTTFDGAPAGVRLAALAGAGMLYWLWNSVTVATAVALSQQLPFLTVYRKGLLLSVLVALGNTATGVVLVALADVNPVALAAVPPLCGLLLMAYLGYLRAMRERDIWELLHRASRELLVTDEDELAQAVVARCAQLFDAEVSELLLVDAEPGTEVTGYRLAKDGGLTRISGSPFDAAPSVWGRLLSEREPFQLQRRHASSSVQADLAGLGLASCQVAPLLNGDRCIGAVRIGFRGEVRLGERDMQILATFANQVSAAVSHARSFEKVRTAALHDPLTGLANRALLSDRLTHALARGKRTGRRVAVLFCDLDRFKVVNDAMGHEAGDELIVAVAQRISSRIRPGDTAVRFGGDEFVVVCDDIENESEALLLADRVSDALRDPFSIRGRDTYMTLSIGVVVARGDEDPIALVRDADAAMYLAKGAGRARAALFDEELRTKIVTRVERENDLRLALSRGELVVHYQPTVDVHTQRVVGAEALVRWQHPTLGLLGPAEFIDVAEEANLINELGDFVLRQALHDARTMPQMYVAVNLSAGQLLEPGFPDRVASLLATTGIASGRLCLEITETVLMDDTTAAITALRELRALGVEIALDDFGTGYSSLSYLRDLPVDVVKIDRSFVANLASEPRDRAIVGSIVAVSHSLGLTVIGEGVETPAQLGHLTDVGCDTVQGFYFSPPVPIAELHEVLATDALIPVGDGAPGFH